MKSVTFRLDADVDALAVGVAGGMLWSRVGFVIGALGQAMRLPINRAERQSAAETAQAALAAMPGPDELDLPGSGPVALAAMPFDPDLAGELVVPEILVGSTREGRRWITLTSDGELDLATALGRLDEAVSTENAEPQAQSLELSSPVAPEAWRDEIVAVATQRIRSGELTKAVLARELVLTAGAPIDQRAVLRRLTLAHPSATVFALDGFIGASPELLVSRVEDVVRAHPLAGTAPRASDQGADQLAAAGLLASAKDRWEHRITIDWLLDELLPFCSYVDAEPDPSIVSLPTVHHLGTRVEGRLSSPPVSALELVAALHPTPAVCGDPQQQALKLIAELERADRGRYAGPMGWVDARGNGAFVVAIRSAQLSGSVARLFAGVGVVADSDPVAELNETRAKFQAMLPALLQL